MLRSAVRTGVLLLAASASCAFASVESVRVESEPFPSERRLLVVCIDGLQADAFEDLLEQGKLPRIADLLARYPHARGRSLASFPSSTAPSVPEFLTGRYADRTPAMPRSIHAFDRDSGRARRYSLEPGAWEDGTPTLFSLLEARGDSSISVFEGHFDGSDSWSSRRAIVWGGVLEFLHIPVYNPDRALARQFRRMVEERGEPPRAAFLMLNSVDLAGHVRGPDSRRYRSAIEATDRVLGELFEWMAGYTLPGGSTYLDSTTVVLFGDHGMEQAPRFVDLEAVVRSRGLTVVDLGTLFQVAIREKVSPRWAERPEVVLAPGGSNVTQVYLKPKGGTWGSEPAGPDETKAMADLLERTPGVEFVIRRVGPATLELRAAKHLEARLVQTESEGKRSFAYLVSDDDGLDPLGYLADPTTAALVTLTDGTALDDPPPAAAFHDIEEWNLATRETEYPLAVPLLLKGCAAGPTQGDLVVTSSRGWSFLRHGRGDHGGLRRESMETELVLAGRAIEGNRELDGARLVDLLPTFLEILEVPADPAFLASLDGRALPVTERSSEYAIAHRLVANRSVAPPGDVVPREACP